MTDTLPYEVVYRGNDRKKFLHARSGPFIGASDVAAVLGFSKFQTPYEVWQKKTGRVEQTEQNQYMEWGIALESAIARRFSVRHGHEQPRQAGHRPIGKVLPSPGVLRSKKYPWLAATPDRNLAVFRSPGRMEPLEIKTANAFSRSDWDEGVPLFYEAQNQSQQLVMHGLDDAEMGYVVPLLGGNDMPDPFDIPFDRGFAEEYLIDRLEEWVRKHLVEDTPPPLTLADDLNLSAPMVPGAVKVADGRVAQLVAERNVLQPKMSADKKRDDEIKQELKLFMLEATTLVDSANNPLVTWAMPMKPPSPETVLDEDALRAVHPEIYAEFTVTRLKTQSRTMTFK